jgi:sec-independent protein translocase protein TatA
MGGLSLWHWLVVIAVILVLFGGKGKITNVMGDFAKGIKAFKSGMKEEEAVAPPPPQVPPPPASATATADHPAHDRV